MSSTISSAKLRFVSEHNLNCFKTVHIVKSAEQEDCYVKFNLKNLRKKMHASFVHYRFNVFVIKNLKYRHVQVVI